MLKILIYCCFLLVVQINAEPEPLSKTVTITQGSVKGYKSEEWGIYEFYGIPYATVPPGPHKFKAPLPPPAWLQTFEAVDKGITCPQFVDKRFERFFDKINIQENCLIANVYVPDTEEKNLPVVVYVHGGAYQIGSGRWFTPEALVKDGNIIAITFNYRLGVHGFLCLGTEDVPGNAGMKDQVALLRWVKKNIAKFGGNPDDVTIDGFSAGSSAVELLMLSDSTRGLFNQVVPESGSALSVWSVQQNPIENAKNYASLFNFSKIDDVYALEEFYKTTNLESLNQDNFLNREDSTFFFVPCIERETKSESFLRDAPIDILRNGKFPKIPMLFGFANMEGIFRADLFQEWSNRMNEKFSDFLPADLTFKSSQEKESIANIVKEFYFGKKPVNDKTIQGYVDYFTDVLFAYSTLNSIRHHVKFGNTNIFLYEYSYVDDAIQNVTPLRIRGANHCAQTFAIYSSKFKMIKEESDDFKKIKATLINLWVNFYRTGKPVPEPTTEFPQGWPQTSANGSPYMSLDMPSVLKSTRLLEERVKFWDKIYDQYYLTPVPPPTPPVRHTEL